MLCLSVHVMNAVFTSVCDECCVLSVYVMNVVFTVVCAHQAVFLELVRVDDIDLSPV